MDPPARSQRSAWIEPANAPEAVRGARLFAKSAFPPFRHFREFELLRRNLWANATASAISNRTPQTCTVDLRTTHAMDDVLHQLRVASQRFPAAAMCNKFVLQRTH